jgi:glutathione synthase/RimK-type ligase-like ATP-grasp enzyme
MQWTMAKLALFVERATVRCASEMNALLRFREAASLRAAMSWISCSASSWTGSSRYDGLLLRAFTDPLNTTFIASRTAALLGKRVIDDPESILVCCDKVHMYRRLMRGGVPIPATRFARARRADAGHRGAPVRSSSDARSC